MGKPTVEDARRAGEQIVNCRVEAIEKAGGTFPKIARELAAIAFSDIADYITIAEGGELQPVPLETIPPKKRKALRKIKENTRITEAKDGALFKDSRVEYELYDKLDALKYLCRLRGDEVQKVDHTGTLTLELKDAKARLIGKLLPEAAAGGKGPETSGADE